MKTIKHSVRAVALVLLSWTLLQAAPQAKNPPANAPSGAQSHVPNAADMKEFYNYTLTMDRTRKLAAIEKDLDTLQKSDPQLRQSLESDNSAADLDEAAQKLQKHPEAAAIMKKYGMTPREYIVDTISFIQAATAVGFKKNGTYKDYPPQVRQVVSPANLAFVEQHWEDIAKIMPTFADENRKTTP